ncbi:hypothetical protein PMAYCL1PPCAC_23049, partial [Pristionchus mayeri]
MSNIDLALDDIIAKTKSIKKIRGHKNLSKGRKSDKMSGRKIGGGVKKRSNGMMKKGAEFTKTLPNGKWKHDKFASLDSVRTLGSTSIPLESVVNANKRVRMNISNLAQTVNTADLEELFSSYFIDSVSVHYGEKGNHLGTAEVVMKRRNAERAINDLKGISIDGSLILLAMVDGGKASSIFDRVQFAKKINGGPGKKR